MTPEQMEYEIIKLRMELTRYHSELEEALDHNAQFQLKATWGIVNSAVGIGAFIGSLIFLKRLWTYWLGHNPGWIADVILVLPAGVIWFFATEWSERGQEGDRKKLYRWPKWSE